MPGVVRAYDNELRGDGNQMFAFEDTNFANIAESFGCTGIRVESPADLAGAFEATLAAKGPVVIDVVTDLNAFPQKPWS